MEQQFLAEAELIKGLPKLLEGMTKTKQTKIYTKRTRRLLDLEVDGPNQTASFIFSEEVSHDEKPHSYPSKNTLFTKENSVVIGVYYKGRSHQTASIKYSHYVEKNSEKQTLEKKPHKNYSQITSMETGKDVVSVVCSSETESISRRFTFL